MNDLTPQQQLIQKIDDALSVLSRTKASVWHDEKKRLASLNWYYGCVREHLKESRGLIPDADRTIVCKSVKGLIQDLQNTKQVDWVSPQLIHEKVDRMGVTLILLITLLQGKEVDFKMLDEKAPTIDVAKYIFEDLPQTTD